MYFFTYSEKDLRQCRDIVVQECGEFGPFTVEKRNSTYV